MICKMYKKLLKYMVKYYKQNSQPIALIRKFHKI